MPQPRVNTSPNTSGSPLINANQGNKTTLKSPQNKIRKYATIMPGLFRFLKRKCNCWNSNRKK